MGITPEEIERLLLSRSYFVPVQERATIIQDDPSDNHILSCALASRASCIVWRPASAGVKIVFQHSHSHAETVFEKIRNKKYEHKNPLQQ